MHKKFQKVQKYLAKCNNNCRNICQSAKVLEDDTHYLLMLMLVMMTATMMTLILVTLKMQRGELT